MEVSRHYNFIRRWFGGWLGPQETLPTNPDHPLFKVDPNLYEVVAKDFVIRARQHYAELNYLEDALREKTEENEKLRELWQTSVSELAQLNDIKKALHEKTEECDSIRGHWQAAIGELSDLKSSKRTFMVDDAEMAAKWKRLQYVIKNLARSYMSQTIPLEKLSEDQEKLLNSVTPLYQDLLSTEGKAHLLFQSLVWMHITKRILRNPAVVWGQEFAAAVNAVTEYTPNSVEDYHAWRAQTGEIIQNGRGVCRKQELHLKTRLYSMILNFIPEETLFSEKHTDIILRAAGGIIDKAIELAVIFNQSRCVYKTKGVVYKQRFSSTTMEYDEECDEREVDLMISPALIKDGNSMGKDYDQRLILAKSYVYSFHQEEDNKEDEEEDELIEL
ncbi:hypothetical protein F5Y12DRAFT_786236 [Xylaria sp. FL1777]|nr:hypothetical protein F5Y12DRAFT_786236 [Xylaria sp. FL1777]